MTVLSFDDKGVEDAIQKSYPEVTDHEVLQIVEDDPSLSGEPRRIGEIID
jgi:hypothetical protein